MKIPDIKELRGTEHKKPEYMKRHWPEFYEHLQRTYPSSSIPASIYMFFNGIDEHPKCACGKLLEYRSPKLGFRKFCSVKCATNSKETRIKAAKTNNERYGGTGFASQKLAEKAASTNIRRYGAANAMCNRAIFDKQRATMIESYGAANPSQSPELMARIKQTQEERYGGFGMGAEHMQSKSKETLTSLYGVEYNGQRQDVITKSKHSRVRSIRKKYPIIQSVTWRDGLKIYTCSCPHPGTCNRCNGRFEIFNEHFYRRIQDGTELCTVLLPYQHPHQHNTSVEVFIKMLLDNWGVQYIQNDRTVLTPKEVDFYIPSRKIAIECNGLRWHSTEFKDKQYHYNKFTKCSELGIQLISIWEDWIVNAPNIVSSLLYSKLGLGHRTIHARKCEVRKVDHNESNDFLFANHIQGKCVSSVRLGLYFNNELVSLMTFGKKRPGQGNKTSTWELIRFCNKLGSQIPGAASRLLKHFIRNYNPNHIISFSSNDISTGDLYKQLGFIRTNQSLAYWYVGRDYKRHHRFTFCKAKLVKMGYDSSKTETEIMRSLPYYCIYDSGQTKWELKLQ